MSGNSQDNLKKTALYNKHLEAGAKMVPFSGWSMPVQYSGIINEHIHTRTKAGLFDICHMGEFYIKGSSTCEDLEDVITCRVSDMPVGKCRYGFLLNDTGGIVDDLIVFRTGDNEYMLVVNAGRIDADKTWVEAHLSEGTGFRDESDKIAKLDLQGPLSGDVLGKVIGADVAGNIERFTFIKHAIEGADVIISRTGYTGEMGYELFFPNEHAEKLWDIFLAFDEVEPVGLGARDTLRMEKGYSLYGSDIDEEHTPLESNLARFVYMEKDFIGKDALLRQQDNGFERILTGFLCEGRRSARSHFIVSADDKAVGEVTSGAFSPCLKKGMGLCYINKKYASNGQEVILADGKTKIEAEIKSLPIY